MTRPKPSLHQHLLTRSDLARLQVPAGEVLSWLADGCIEQVGALPDAEGAADPVFTVLSNRLRQDLALRLVDIGKPTVVLTPLRVRSFLMRALIGTTSGSDAASPTASDRAEQHLADVLREVVAEVEADVDDVLRLATEEAGLEAADAPAPAACVPMTATTAVTAMTAMTAVTAVTTPTRDALLASGEATDAPAIEVAANAGIVMAADLDTCFDADEISAALAALAATASAVQEAADAAAPLLDVVAGAVAANPDELAAAATPCPVGVAHAVAPNSDEVADAVGTAAPAPIDDPTAPNEPDSTMASETTLSSEPEAAAMLDTSEPIAAAAVIAVVEPATAPCEPAVTSTANATAVAPMADLAAPTDAPATATPACTPEPVSSDAAPSPSPFPCTPSPEQTIREATEAVLERTVQRVESFLGELQKSLLAIAQRPEAEVPPPPPPAPTSVDVAPIVNALQAGFERSAHAGTAVQAALTTIGERVNGLGERMAAVAERVADVGTNVEHGMLTIDKTLQAIQSTETPRQSPKDERVVPGIVIGRSDRSPTALIAVATMVIAWSVVFWVKMESPRLAIATLIGANLVGCCLLAASRPRP